MNLLDRALTQTTEVKLKKQKPLFTKKEIEILIRTLIDHPFAEIKGEINVILKKLNNQLKEMI